MLATNLPQSDKPTDFESCVAAGNPVMGSYPRRCSADSKTFIEDIENNTNIEEYFLFQFEEQAIVNLGAMPIEGFNPELYKIAFPGLQDPDFNNADAIGGPWVFENNQLTQVKTSNGVATSADGKLTNSGRSTLLQNLAPRLNIQTTSKINIDQIIAVISDDKRSYCTPSQRLAEACIEIYQPVCGWSDPAKIQCITFPCASTYSKSCFACQDENVLYTTDGECPISN